MVHTAKVLLSQLNLDQENYRLGETANQRATIRALIEDQGKKLVNHAQDLVKLGLSPGEFIWVTPDIKNAGMFVVLEGNRRVASLKLLETPSLADGTSAEKTFTICPSSLTRRFENLKFECSLTGKKRVPGYGDGTCR